jgi:hypothetical protein
MRSALRIPVVFVACTIFIAIAACAPSPAAEPTGQPETLISTLSAMTSSLMPGSFSESVIPTPKPTLTRTLEPTKIPDLSPTELDPASSIVLPGWVPQGARARLGRGKINQIAVSPDGKTIAVAGETGLFLLTADTFQKIWSVPTRMGIDSISFNSDGKTLATISLNKTEVDFYLYQYELENVNIWDSTTGRLLKSIPFREKANAYAFSADGTTLAVGTSSKFGIFQLDALKEPSK